MRPDPPTLSKALVNLAGDVTSICYYNMVLGARMTHSHCLMKGLLPKKRYVVVLVDLHSMFPPAVVVPRHQRCGTCEKPGLSSMPPQKEFLCRGACGRRYFAPSDNLVRFSPVFRSQLGRPSFFSKCGHSFRPPKEPSNGDFLPAGSLQANSTQ